MALIYRQAALDKFKPWLKVKGYSEGELNILRAVIYELENLPDAEHECWNCKHQHVGIDEPCFHCTAEEPKWEPIEPYRRGKWIDKSGGIEGAWNYCSVCGEQAIDLYDFCPNCGAKMEGVIQNDSYNNVSGGVNCRGNRNKYANGAGL
jgi:hypothetical protein